MTRDEEQRRASTDRMSVRELYSILQERTDAIDQHFKMQDRAVQAAFTAAKEALTKAEAASEKRFDSVNEFRGQQRDLIQTFIPRQEYNVQHDPLVRQLNALENALSNLQGRMWAVNAVAFLVTIAVAVGVRFIH